MKDGKVYEDLIEWFRQNGAYVPESEALLPLIQATYTEEEAELLAGMPLALFEIEDLAEKKGMEPSNLAVKLDELARKGLVYRTKAGGKHKYRLNPPRFVYLRSFFWPGGDQDHIKAVAPHVTRYYLDGLGDHWKDVQTKGLRALPIEKTIEDPRSVLPYEAVLKILEEQDRFAVATCACRHRKNSDPSLVDCEHETENCLHFGKFAEYIIENGLGREIDLEECRDILQRAAEAGLVHAASNWQENVDTICNCCECCCVYFQAFHVLKHDSSMNRSNYVVQPNAGSCKACGLCVQRCPMEALQLVESPRANNKKGKVCSARLDLCIGCGICAYKCPTSSLRLKRRERMVEPPANAAELKERYAREKKEKYAREGRGVEADKVFLGDVSSGEVIR